MVQKNHGVYAITHIDSLKMYIGKGAVRPDGTCSRWRVHLQPSADGLLARAIKKHGVNRFVFGWLEIDRSEYAAFALERKHIVLWKTTNREFGYNLSFGGEGSVVGTKHRAEVIEVIRQKAIGRYKGRIASLETRAKMSAARMGKKRSPESIEKQIRTQTGSKRGQRGIYRKKVNQLEV